LIRKVGIFNTSYKNGQMDGHTLGITGSGKANLWPENGPFVETVRVGGKDLAGSALQCRRLAARV
jgi:hypothetical protein